MRETGRQGVQARCVKSAKDRGFWARKFKSPANNSEPDYIFASLRGLFFVEFKATGKLPNELQKQEHEWMRETGMRVYVIDSHSMFRMLLNCVESGKWPSTTPVGHPDLASVASGYTSAGET